MTRFVLLATAASATSLLIGWRVAGWLNDRPAAVARRIADHTLHDDYIEVVTVAWQSDYYRS